MPPVPASLSRSGPIANCLAALRDLRLDSQELQGTLRDVVARTGAAGPNTALHDWRTYIERYEQTVAGASKAASQLRALIKTYLILQEKKHEAKAEDMIVELSSLQSILEGYRFDFKASCKKLCDDIAESYGNITPDMLESTVIRPSGAISHSVIGSAQIMLPGARFISEEPMSELPNSADGDTNVKAAMLRVAQFAALMKLRKPLSRNSSMSAPGKPGIRRRRSAPKARAMSDPAGLRTKKKVAGKRRIPFGPCGKLEHFDDATETATRSQSQPMPVVASEVARTETQPRRLSLRKRRTTGSVNLASNEAKDQRAQPLDEDAFRELSQAINCVLNELDRLTPKFDTFSELAHHLRNEITAYINAFAGYRAQQTPAKRNALENMHARVEATSAHWKECLIALGEGLSRNSR
ncbi:hypothetical protein FKP32DRAFT_1604453 [Trametes sanguinea]|nr:hypothetical protein FKP32DRAFT_1604453 [Trametes sanguinea]